MIPLTYKTFTWPVNPHTYRDEMVRLPRYETAEDMENFVGMSPVIRRITGSGAFYGEGAYQNLLTLAEIFQDVTPGYLEHPVWGRCYCYFTELELTQEPRKNYVSYRFTFTGALSNGDIPK